MMILFDKNSHIVSFRKIVPFLMSIIVLPLFIVILLFDWYTVQQQLEAVQTSHRNTLSIYRLQLENTLQIAENFVSDTVANNNNFEAMIYGNSRTEIYLSSREIAEQCKPLLKAYNMLGGFYIYSSKFDYYRITYTGSYPQQDLNTIRQSVISAAKDKASVTGWYPITLSDRTVVMYTYVRDHTVISAMVDPSLQLHSDLGPQENIFYIQSDGSPYRQYDTINNSEPLLPVSSQKIYYNNSSERYTLTFLLLSTIDGAIVYASPYISFFKQLNLVQRILIFITIGLLVCILLCWLTFLKWVIKPVHLLTNTMHAIQSGNIKTRVPQESNIREVREIIETVNTMLDTINQQKITFYEQQLEVQHAQLQYLQLQIRPHFFLNCLNIIYSLAGENKYHSIQEITLELSTYLRSIFKDSSKLVPLNEEIHSVEAYIHIQQIGAHLPPQLKICMDADATEIPIPPLSILTFVENSIKYSQLANSPLEILINCTILRSEDGNYLNIKIRDNGGGFSPEQLESLNKIDNTIYADKHIGISNIRHRLRLLYGERVSLCFMNWTHGACIELFIPLQ